VSKIIQNPGIRECRRCGTCCKKGGPCFHLEDKILIEKGIILSKYLYTVREYELCYDNVRESILPAASDIIKIKGQKNSLACIFFNEKENECTIYDNRPLECRALKCWDTREIEKIYSKNRLTRKDLLSNVEGLWDLVEDHQKQCSYEKLTLFIDILKKGQKDKALKGILDIIKYDAQIRELVVQKGGLDPEMTDFIFGRPITETIRIYGFKIKKQNGSYRLIPIG
jgi:Fe-S-cluster containining protein